MASNMSYLHDLLILSCLSAISKRGSGLVSSYCLNVCLMLEKSPDCVYALRGRGAIKPQITRTMTAPTTAPISPAPSSALYHPIAWPI